MSRAAPPTKDGRTVTVRVSFALRKHGGRKLVVSPEGANYARSQDRVDSAMAKALARAHRWKRLIESGQYASVADLAGAERINDSYLCRILRLTLLAPDIVEAILDGRQVVTLQLDTLLKPFAPEWHRQREYLTC